MRGHRADRPPVSGEPSTADRLRWRHTEARTWSPEVRKCRCGEKWPCPDLADIETIIEARANPPALDVERLMEAMILVMAPDATDKKRKHNARRIAEEYARLSQQKDR